MTYKPLEAYWKALDSRYTRELEEIACKDPYYAYMFALIVPGTDLKYCLEACKKEPYYAYCFAFDIPGADIEYCLEACKGTKYYAEIQRLIMEE